MYHFAPELIIRAWRIEKKVRAAINIIHLFEWAEFYDFCRLLFSPLLRLSVPRTDGGGLGPRRGG